MIGRFGGVVIDCPDPKALATFYSELLGMPVTNADADWADVSDGKTLCVSFQKAPDHQAPRWPDPAFPQQFHIDVMVDDIDESEPKLFALGATRLPGEGSTFRVYADPAGHPFCLCTQ